MTGRCLINYTGVYYSLSEVNVTFRFGNDIGFSSCNFSFVFNVSDFEKSLQLPRYSRRSTSVFTVHKVEYKDLMNDDLSCKIKEELYS